jgi:hypothetical protein
LTIRNRFVSEEGLYAITQSPGFTGPLLHGTQSGKIGTVVTMSPSAMNVGSILGPCTCNHTRVPPPADALNSSRSRTR